MTQPAPQGGGPERDHVLVRLWQAAGFMPRSVRLLGTRYRGLFLAYAQQFKGTGQVPAAGDAAGFISFMFRQQRVGLLAREEDALRADEKRLRRRFKLKRRGGEIEAVEKWRIRQWLHL